MPNDLAVNLFLNHYLASGILNYILIFFTYLGNGLLWVIICIICLCFKKSRYFGLNLTISLILTFLIGNLIKISFPRLRPYQEIEFDLLIPPPNGTSFPSLHTACAFSMATICFFNFNKKPYRYFRIPIILIAFLIAFSRIYLMVHYLTDCLAGAALGIIIAYLTQKIVFKAYKNKKLRFLKLPENAPNQL